MAKVAVSVLIAVGLRFLEAVVVECDAVDVFTTEVLEVGGTGVCDMLWPWFRGSSGTQWAMCSSRPSRCLLAGSTSVRVRGLACVGDGVPLLGRVGVVVMVAR